jgi:hypothetical protein
MRDIDRNDQDELMAHFLDGIHKIEPDDLAFLFATGKSELEIRTQIALHLNRIKGINQTISREWNRHDLAVLEDGLPAIVVEGKSWLHADAVYEKKMMHGEKSIRHGLQEDIRKITKTADKFPHLVPYITMLNFSIDVRELADTSFKNADIKYENTHRHGLEKYGTLEDLAGNGRSRISELLSNYGTVKRAPIHVGRYLGMPIEADFYLLHPND